MGEVSQDIKGHLQRIFGDDLTIPQEIYKKHGIPNYIEQDMFETILYGKDNSAEVVE